MLTLKTIIRIILIGVIAVILYWTVETVIMVNVFPEDDLIGGDFIGEFFNPHAHELWMRTTSALILFVLVSFGQYMLTIRKMTITKLEKTLAEVNTLSGLLPICAWCKKLRDDEGYWKSVEEYISSRTGAEFTHGMCPECQEKFFSESSTEKNSERNSNTKVS